MIFAGDGTSLNPWSLPGDADSGYAPVIRGTTPRRASMTQPMSNRRVSPRVRPLYIPTRQLPSQHQTNPLHIMLLDAEERQRTRPTQRVVDTDLSGGFMTLSETTLIRTPSRNGPAIKPAPMPELPKRPDERPAEKPPESPLEPFPEPQQLPDPIEVGGEKKPWYKDWRYWAVIGTGAVVIGTGAYLVTR